jgi:hypothetical protein
VRRVVVMVVIVGVRTKAYELEINNVKRGGGGCNGKRCQETTAVDCAGKSEFK